MATVPSVLCAVSDLCVVEVSGRSSSKIRYCFSILTKIRPCRQILVELPNIKFHENPFSGLQIVTCDRGTVVAKLTGAFLRRRCEHT
jgi:hypothetical protein